MRLPYDGRAAERMFQTMTWDRSDTIALAKTACTHCHGYGMRVRRNNEEGPCECVFRAIFRACYARFRYLAQQEKHVSRVKLELCAGKERSTTYGRRVEEYLADFCLVSRRTLTPREYDLFRFHYLLGADWRLCSRRLAIDRGTFFHEVYRIEQKLGRVFRELEPYCLYPLEEYFGQVAHKQPVFATAAVASRYRVLRPPLQRTAA
jgi:hypothetical protein